MTRFFPLVLFVQSAISAGSIRLVSRVYFRISEGVQVSINFFYKRWPPWEVFGPD
jgi:hypothetical protein